MNQGFLQQLKGGLSANAISLNEQPGHLTMQLRSPQWVFMPQQQMV